MPLDPQVKNFLDALAASNAPGWETMSPAEARVAAQALGRFGSQEDVDAALTALIDLAHLGKNGVYVSMLALNALDALDGRADAEKDVIARLPRKDASVPARMSNYVDRLIRKTVADLN